MAITTHDPSVLGHAMVARIGSVHGHPLQPIKDHVLFDPAEEIKRTLLATTFPETQVDGCFVINDEDALSLPHPLAQSLGLDSFERAQVMFVQPFSSRQMLEGMAAQIQRVEVTDSHFGALVPRIVRGGFVPMAIASEALVVG